MDTAESDVEWGKRLVCRIGISTNSADQFPYADGTVVVDAGFLGGLQFIGCTLGNPPSCCLLIAEADGADGTGGVTILANLATWRISAQ